MTMDETVKKEGNGPQNGDVVLSDRLDQIRAKKSLGEKLIDHLAEKSGEAEAPADPGAPPESDSPPSPPEGGTFSRIRSAYQSYYQDFKEGVRFTDYGLKNIPGMFINMFIDLFDLSSDRPLSVRLVRILTIGIVLFALLTVVLAALFDRSNKSLDYVDFYAAPYEVGERPMPSMDAHGQLALPETLGEFVRVTHANPNPRETYLYRAVQGVEERFKEGLHLSFDPLDTGVYDVVEYPGSAGGRSLEPGSVTFAAGRLSSEYGTVVMMRVLRQYITQNGGTIGNFAIGMAESSYMYYTLNDTRSFAWTRGTWVFTVSGDSLARVRAFVEAFPY